MDFSITNLKADLSGILHGTTLDQITNLDGVIERAGRQVLQDIDPQETKRILPIVNALYNSVYDYPLPVDVKGNRIIDIRPQVNRYPQDWFKQSYNRDFDRLKRDDNQNQFTLNFNGSIKTARISAPYLPVGLTLNEADNVVGNGTWVNGTNTTNIATDNVNFASKSGSISFDLSAGSNPLDGFVYNSTMSAQDLTAYLDQGTLFAYVFLPTATDFNSVTLSWGSDDSNYWYKTVTVTQQNTVLQSGWNLLQFDWKTATKVGSPVVTAIDYLKVNFNYDGVAQTAVRIDSIVCRLGSIFEIEYYSKYLYRNASTNVFQEHILDDSDYINLDLDAVNMLVYRTAIFTAQQAQGYSAIQFDYAFFEKEYAKAMDRYISLYKSEVQKPQSQYYKEGKAGNTKFFNRRTY